MFDGLVLEVHAFSSFRYSYFAFDSEIGSKAILELIDLLNGKGEGHDTPDEIHCEQEAASAEAISEPKSTYACIRCFIHQPTGHLMFVSIDYSNSFSDNHMLSDAKSELLYELGFRRAQPRLVSNGGYSFGLAYEQVED